MQTKELFATTHKKTSLIHTIDEAIKAARHVGVVPMNQDQNDFASSGRKAIRETSEKIGEAFETVARTTGTVVNGVAQTAKHVASVVVDGVQKTTSDTLRNLQAAPKRDTDPNS
ncbi:hypothetical protein [Sulfoacidibacillus thermotolerans]|uniref:Uncharacterized protein n=1 Tax=Sulfoacidibacillus thermotolerans TaxID=1765684 RepID=A0A2U3D910_SULT2|nr:hypothetical protein [Sulfoacidibacillus thermotolerans]PWI57768.1 hypothetical protein BM613_07245 [Sulfoacidibacillus thermotolerans]